MRYAARVLLGVAVLALASTGCATLENGTTQRIPVTSDPPGAQVLLDGRPVGVTPTQITISRRNREPEIEVVMDGFTQSSHRLERREDWATIFWSAFLGAGLIPTVGRLTLPHEDAEIGFWHTIGIFALGVVPGAIDFGSGGAFGSGRIGSTPISCRSVRGACSQCAPSVPRFCGSQRWPWSLGRRRRCARCSLTAAFCFEMCRRSATSAFERSIRSVRVRHGRELPLHRSPGDVQPSRPVADART